VKFRRRAKRPESRFQAHVIAPDHDGVTVCDRLDTMASQNVLPLNIEAVSTTRNRTRVIDQACPRTRIEHWANDRLRQRRGRSNPFADELGRALRQRLNRIDNGEPFRLAHGRLRCQSPATLVASFAARPGSMARLDLPDTG